MLPDTSEQSVYRWARQGKLRAVVLPSGRKFFRREDIEKLLVPVVTSSVSGDDVVLPGQGALL